MIMKKILIVLTGGTIGSQAEGECVNVTDTSPYRLLRLYKETYGQKEADEEEFEVIQHGDFK